MNTRTNDRATQTTFGTTPPAKYTPEEKEKMFWSNQPPLGLMTGNYYKMKVYLLAEITAL